MKILSGDAIEREKVHGRESLKKNSRKFPGIEGHEFPDCKIP